MGYGKREPQPAKTPPTPTAPKPAPSKPGRYVKGSPASLPSQPKPPKK